MTARACFTDGDSRLTESPSPSGPEKRTRIPDVRGGPNRRQAAQGRPGHCRPGREAPGRSATRSSWPRSCSTGGEASLRVGTPLVDGAKVVGTITDQGRGPKIVVFKLKRRKNYRRKQGHRQSYHRDPRRRNRGPLKMSHKKGQGSSRNGRDSNGQRRGVKIFGGQTSRRARSSCARSARRSTRGAASARQGLHALRAPGRHRPLRQVARPHDAYVDA